MKLLHVVSGTAAVIALVGGLADSRARRRQGSFFAGCRGCTWCPGWPCGRWGNCRLAKPGLCSAGLRTAAAAASLSRVGTRLLRAATASGLSPLLHRALQRMGAGMGLAAEPPDGLSLNIKARIERAFFVRRYLCPACPSTGSAVAAAGSRSGRARYRRRSARALARG